MRSLLHYVGLIIVCALLFVSCDPSSANTEITLNAIVVDTSEESREITEVSKQTTPSNYKVALTYFALIKDDGTIVPIIEEEAPTIVDFSGTVPAAGLLLSRKVIPKGTYIGYEMRFTYIEMDLYSSFDVPDESTDSTHTLVTNSDPDSGSARVHFDNTFRMYFNTDGEYWKRDLVVKTGEDDESAPIWSWMRRVIEEDSSQSFFITQETHPAFGIIDLFDNPEFWGLTDDYDNPETIITISTEDDTGAVNATMGPVTITVDTALLLKIDITDTFDFKEYEDGGAAVSVYDNEELDLGPLYDLAPGGEGGGDYYVGDHGFHPMMPKFNLISVD